MKWLAVDYGDSRTGLAGCDAGETITSPITPQIEEKSMNKVAAAVTAVAQARGAEALVCGLPKKMVPRAAVPTRAAALPSAWQIPRTCRWCFGMSAAPRFPPPPSWPITILSVPSARNGWIPFLPPSFWKAF